MIEGMKTCARHNSWADLLTPWGAPGNEESPARRLSAIRVPLITADLPELPSLGVIFESQLAHIETGHRHLDDEERQDRHSREGRIRLQGSASRDACISIRRQSLRKPTGPSPFLPSRASSTTRPLVDLVDALRLLPTLACL